MEPTSLNFGISAGQPGAAQPGTNPGMAPAAADLVKEIDITTFMQDVVQASMQQPVLVDFWAPWCGPCKQLGPALEKATLAAKGKFKLVKVNIDDPRNQPLAQQLRIQSIPAVYAFSKGQPVDGFVGALPDSQLKKFIEQVVGGAVGDSEAVQLIEAGKAALAAQDWAAAGEAFSGALGSEPENPAALGGLARALVGLGELESVEEILAQVPPAHENHADVASARSALQLAQESAGAAGELAALEAKVAADPKDYQARYDYALALVGANRQGDALDQLLDIVKLDRKWNDEAARKQLVKIFEALGPMDPLVVDARRRLSSILFA
ncbi:co-chaperone YbbN [Ferrovibrio sp.]|uniref:thioredoxin family protein n=1 Tax=Ferrovibrio sp. TaxID=1917215 RepID=UPI0025B9C036|nr:co-chaperone YbbN [Ferrovibrio sp.]